MNKLEEEYKLNNNNPKENQLYYKKIKYLSAKIFSKKIENINTIY